ncbi:MAG: TetR/AcrR family transcriptional regulator [Pyrinomonadaceae bacterium]
MKLNDQNIIGRGEKTRHEILRTSVDIASADGLNGLTIGRLATELQMSKSGLFAHFGSKEDLQIATLKAASDTFITEVVVPAERLEHGLPRLAALLNAWIGSVATTCNRGGCFFYAVSAEMDDRPGKVRDFVVKLTREWIDALTREMKLAIRLGELRKSCDAELVVFQLHGFVQEGNWFRRLQKSDRAFQMTRESVYRTLENHATPSGKSILSSAWAKR